MIIQCSFGDMDMGKEVTINIELELNPAVLQISPVSITHNMSALKLNTNSNLRVDISNKTDFMLKL